MRRLRFFSCHSSRLSVILNALFENISSDVVARCRSYADNVYAPILLLFTTHMTSRIQHTKHTKHVIAATKGWNNVIYGIVHNWY